MKIRIKGDSIRFRLTQTEVKALSENGKIHDSTNFGNDHNFKTSDKNEIYLLLEKDFTCLDNTIEDQSDNYPNPKLG